jgi:hypothetical protein
MACSVKTVCDENMRVPACEGGEVEKVWSRAAST